MVRLSEAEKQYLDKVQQQAGLTNTSETLRFIINMSKLTTEGKLAVYPDPNAFIAWMESQGIIKRVNPNRNEGNKRV